ncbi:hypothetical protein Y032_0006g2813 [Ancylostoma ceylanicum]|nr:hypothetical protein Y032_0006g2813 [Ancylostoma ceylanicum]
MCINRQKATKDPFTKGSMSLKFGARRRIAPSCAGCPLRLQRWPTSVDVSDRLDQRLHTSIRALETAICRDVSRRKSVTNLVYSSNSNGSKDKQKHHHYFRHTLLIALCVLEKGTIF